MTEANTRTNPAPQLELKIAGMDCGSCAMTIETAMRSLPGIGTVQVDFTTETLRATGEITREQIETRLRELGYRIAEPMAVRVQPQVRGLGGFLQFMLTEPRTRIALGMTALLAAAIGWTMATGGHPLVVDAVLIGIVLITGAPIVVKGLRALLVARRVTIDLLMGLAAIGALAIGEAGEAAAVVLLFTLGEALEAYSANRSRDALRSLLSLQPDEATLLVPHAGGHDQDHRAGRDHDGPADHAGHGHAGHKHADHAGHGHAGHDCDHGGHEHGGHEHAGHDCDHHDHAHHAAPAVHYHQRHVPTSSVPVGARVLVKPGERIPLDGRILEGSSAINQASVTGESIPVDRAVGDDVLAGTVNGSSALTIEVVRAAADSTVARIAALVERAMADRTPAERFIDRFARWYTPLVVALAVLVVAVPVLVFGQPLLNPPDGGQGWLYRGLALVIVACPCALIISIPVTVVSALTRLAQLGILVKGGGQLDRLAAVDVMAFDKTGTLTAGRPTVTAVRGRDCVHAEPARDDCPVCDEVVMTALAVESASEHPLARAVASRAAHRGLMARVRAALNVVAYAGKGVAGELAGQRVAVGNHLLFAHGPDCSDVVCGSAHSAQADGKTVMLVGRGNQMLGFIGVEDRPRPESQAALEALRGLRPAVRSVMLTGDHPQVAAAIARAVGGIDDVRAGLLPEDKLGAIRDLQRDGSRVAMVGDGINDAPALAQADVGIAMGGGGTAQAMETADVVLMKDDLGAISTALRAARHTRTVIKQNIVLSLGLKLVVLALAVPGMATLWMAVLADVGATLIVTLNGMRLLRVR